MSSGTATALAQDVAPACGCELAPVNSPRITPKIMAPMIHTLSSRSVQLSCLKTPA